MRGIPKYDYGDVVTFDFRGYVKTGVICVVDPYGTWEDDSDVSYDVWVELEDCIYKHIREDRLRK